MGKSCPYCEADDLAQVQPHISGKDDEAHGPKYEYPDGWKEEAEDLNDVELVDPEDDADGSVDDPDEEMEECPKCGSELYELDEGEPIEFEGHTVATGEEGDLLCRECTTMTEEKVEIEVFNND